MIHIAVVFVFSDGNVSKCLNVITLNYCFWLNADDDMLF